MHSVLSAKEEREGGFSREGGREKLWTFEGGEKSEQKIGSLEILRTEIHGRGRGLHSVH